MRDQEHSEDDRGKRPAPRRHGRGTAALRRRPILFVTVGLCAAALALALITLVPHGHRSGPPNAMADVASSAAPEVAAVMREADEVASRLIERFPNSPDALHVMAQLHNRFGRNEEAVQWWQACVTLDPAFGAAYREIGIIAQENGDFAQAADLFRKAADQDPSSSSIPAHLAEALVSLGKLEEAVGVLEKNLENHPKSMASFALLGDAQVQLKQYAEGRRNLEAAIEMAPGYTNAYYGLTTACAKLGDREKSKEYLEEFKALKARDEQAHRTQLKAQDDVRRVRSHLAQVYTNASKIYLLQEDAQAAEEHLLRAAEVDPDYVGCSQVLIWLYDRQGRRDEALAALDKLRETAPRDLSTQMTLGALSAQLGQFDAAEEAYQGAIELTPLQAGGHAALASLYLQAGRKLPEAKALALKAVALEPVARYYSVLSLACHHNGDSIGARSAIEQAIALDPDNPDYQHAREQIQETN
ncbi:MAG: tetratricopeptide repeat protein [Planctomycetes bacterium]|nr:tetratricopeptide repeat protein [Planctomycetota bacterium]